MWSQWSNNIIANSILTSFFLIIRSTSKMIVTLVLPRTVYKKNGYDDTSIKTEHSHCVVVWLCQFEYCTVQLILNTLQSLYQYMLSLLLLTSVNDITILQLRSNMRNVWYLNVFAHFLCTTFSSFQLKRQVKSAFIHRGFPQKIWAAN